MEKEKINNKNIDADNPQQTPATPPINSIGAYYTNAVRVSYNPYEFYLDLIQYPPKDDGHVDSIRVYVNPINFKHFTNLFVEMLKKYEGQFGPIKI